ncbi:MAG: DUF4387 family protein, partial [Chromatiales bacterium]|nr:DUF4387 family protein [Chromatiales bacterium]
MTVNDLAKKVRSKNAGPFWVTIDVFCDTLEAYQTLLQRLDTAKVAGLFACSANQMKRFDIDDLRVIKFSLPRPVVQGSRRDRDMHGA